MDWRSYFGLERRKQLRSPVTLDVEFCLWDPKDGVPLTDKVSGRLVNISPDGACLISNTVRIDNHHLVMSCGLEGEYLLMIEPHSFPEDFSWQLKSRIAWYNRREPEEEFKFEFGIEFIEICREGEEQEDALLFLENHHKEVNSL